MKEGEVGERRGRRRERERDRKIKTDTLVHNIFLSLSHTFMHSLTLLYWLQRERKDGEKKEREGSRREKEGER